MKRAILIGAGTIAGAVAVLGYQPGTLFSGPTATAAEATSSSTSTTATTTTSTTAAAADTTPTDPSAQATTYTGETIQTRFGPVQVEATVENGSVTAVTALTYPTGDHESAQINASAIPALEQQAVEAQSANISGVSGASYTSAAFAESLQSALVQAGLA